MQTHELPDRFLRLVQLLEREPLGLRVAQQGQRGYLLDDGVPAQSFLPYACRASITIQVVVGAAAERNGCITVFVTNAHMTVPG